MSSSNGSKAYAPAIDLIRREQPDLFAIIETNRTWLSELETLKASYPYSLQYSLRSPHAESFCRAKTSEVYTCDRD